jgi:hypothetical protein
MNTRVKIWAGILCAGVTVLVAIKTVPTDSPTKPGPCYTQDEVGLLMKSMNWTEQEAVTVLDMACKFSKGRK